MEFKTCDKLSIGKTISILELIYPIDNLTKNAILIINFKQCQK